MTGRNHKVSEAEVPAVLTVEEAARLLRISRGSAYEGVRCNQIPTSRIGRRLLVPRAKLLRMLGEEESRPDA
jgi:excisionase family DNA binding protein